MNFRRKPDGSLFVSLALHAVIGAVIIKVLLMPYPFARIEKGKDAVRPERIGFLRLPEAAPAAIATAGRAGGDGRQGKSQPEVKLVAPVTVPTGIPDPVPQRSASQGSGPLVGGGGPVRGITPAYSDPRVWRAPDHVLSAPKTAAQRMDSAIVSFIQPFNDSITGSKPGRDPQDWTFEKGGRKYGIDGQYIRLGKVSIPNALLAMLPLNMKSGGNPTVMERERTMNALNRDIMYQAQRGLNDADFQKAVRSIRERKEREKVAGKKDEKKDEDRSQ
ncbi:MAG: hypothetical protein H0U64_06345 [Gemmatimonadaceae bacterium]|nr:hypothetical protein [Gemmatimonadaceae bacterium]